MIRIGCEMSQVKSYPCQNFGNRTITAFVITAILVISGCSPYDLNAERGGPSTKIEVNGVDLVVQQSAENASRWGSIMDEEANLFRGVNVQTLRGAEIKSIEIVSGCEVDPATIITWGTGILAEVKC